MTVGEVAPQPRAEVLPNLVWIDLETTGLDPDYEVPLEIAVVVTDDGLNVLDQKQFVVSQRIVVNELNPEVFAMHSSNGLIADVVNPKYKYSVQEIDATLGSFLKRADMFPFGVKKPPLCGSSISFERAWLKVHFPIIHGCLDYRSIDVSSIKELQMRWDRYATYDSQQSKSHRALDDILESIEELRWYRTVLQWGTNHEKSNFLPSSLVRSQA